MDYKKIFTAALLLLISFSAVFAETVWEGSAAMSRYGEFPIKGLYGASNSFPVNTIITVENPKTKKNAEIIIVNSLSDKNLFLLLSKDASETLDIKQDEIIPVRVKIIKEVKLPRMSEKVAGKDPDNNPAAAETPVLPEDIKKESGVVIYEEADVPEVPSAADEKAAETDKIERSPELPVVEYIIADTALISSETPPSEAAPSDSEEKKADEVLLSSPENTENKKTEPGKTEFEKKYILSPASPKPPVPDEGEVSENGKYLPRTTEGEFDELARKTFESPEPAGNALLSSKGYTEKLEKKPYLQLAAFSDYELAKHRLESVNIDYPSLIYYDRSKGIYRLLAGPFNNDEKGAALYNLQKRGFKDAFIKQGE